MDQNTAKSIANYCEQYVNSSIQFYSLIRLCQQKSVHDRQSLINVFIKKKQIKTKLNQNNQSFWTLSRVEKVSSKETMFLLKDPNICWSFEATADLAEVLSYVSVLVTLKVEHFLIFLVGTRIGYLLCLLWNGNSFYL